MTEYVIRFLNMLVAALLAPAHRLARLAAVRHEVEAYSAAYEEAQALEASGKPELAKLLRAELEQTIGATLTAGPAPHPALNDDGNLHPPFALEPPRPADSGPTANPPASPPEGQGSPPPPRRRGRPSKKAKAAEQQATKPSDPTPSASPNHP